MLNIKEYQIRDNKFSMEKQAELFSKQKNVIVFIDGSNFLHSLFDCYKENFINIVALSNKLCSINRNLKQVRYYYSYLIEKFNPNLYAKQRNYLEMLKKTPGVVIIEGGKYVKKPILQGKDIIEKIKKVAPDNELTTYIEKGLDVKIAIDLVVFATKNEYDTAILVSGDGDFVPVIETVRAYKKKVQVAAFENKRRRCYDLKNAANSFINLDHIIPSVIKAKKP